MFSDRYRAQKIIVLSFVIILFCAYSHMSSLERALDYQECLLDPDRSDGRELIVKSGAMTGKIFNDTFEIVQNDKKIMVIGDTNGLKSNEYVSLRATFHKGGYLTVNEMHVHKYRRLKIAISIIPTMAVCWIFFRKYKFNFKKMMFVER